MEKYPNAGAGLKKMFIASVGSMIYLLFTLVQFADIFSAVILLVFDMFNGYVLTILTLVGLYQVGKDIGRCRAAFILRIVRIMVSAVARVGVSKIVPIIVFYLVSCTLEMAEEYFVCTSVSGRLDELGENSVAGLGRLAWKIELGCYVVLSVYLMLLLRFLGKPSPIAHGELIVVFISTVYVVIRMVFLYQSFQALQSKTPPQASGHQI